MIISRYSLVLLITLYLPICARAERPPQNRDAAPFALTGTVEAFDESSDLQTDYYQISVRIENVERGPAVKVGDIFVVSCFRWSRPLPGLAGGSGHTSIPDIGDKIHFFAWPRDPGYEGNYPKWYDLIEPSPRPWLTRFLDKRMNRIYSLFIIGIGLLGFVAWRLRKRMSRAPMHKERGGRD